MNKINKLILRCAKDTKTIHHLYDKNISLKLKEMIYKSIYLNCILDCLKYVGNYTCLYRKIIEIIDLPSYKIKMDFKEIIIKVCSRNDIIELGKYFEDNGFLWRSGDKFLNLLDKYFSQKTFNCTLTISQISNISYEFDRPLIPYDSNSIVFKDYKDFIIYFEEKKKISDDFINSLFK